jgi:hypothetical protein
MAVSPVVYRVPTLVPSTVTRTAELRPEDMERIPYALGESAGSSDENWPPAGFTGVTGMTNTNGSVDTTSLLPQPYNIEWVQGDTAIFMFLFTDILWTDTDPGFTDPAAPTWVQNTWAAQVRNPYIYSTYAADYWVPAYGYQYNWWRGHSVVANFTVTANGIVVPDSSPTQWATEVTLTLADTDSANILPGNWYRWDLQTRSANNVVMTHLRGKSRIITEWTVA